MSFIATINLLIPSLIHLFLAAGPMVAHKCMAVDLHLMK